MENTTALVTIRCTDANVFSRDGHQRDDRWTWARVMIMGSGVAVILLMHMTSLRIALFPGYYLRYMSGKRVVGSTANIVPVYHLSVPSIGITRLGKFSKSAAPTARAQLEWRLHRIRVRITEVDDVTE